MSRTMQFLAQERITIDEAYAGDIVGVWDGGNLRIGDTLARGRDVRVRGRAPLLARALRRVTLKDPMKRKQLKKGLDQLSEEGAVQLFSTGTGCERDPILGAVGVLQFEVIEHRLAVGIQGLGPPSAHAFQVRPLGGGRALLAADVRKRRGANCVVDAEGEQSCCSRTTGPCERQSLTTRSLRFLAAVQPARSG